MHAEFHDTFGREKRRKISLPHFCRVAALKNVKSKQRKTHTSVAKCVRCFKDLARLRLAGPVSCFFSAGWVNHESLHGGVQKKTPLSTENCYHFPPENGLIVPVHSWKAHECSPSEIYSVFQPCGLTDSQGQILAVWISAAKLNFAVEFWVDFFLLFFLSKKARKNPPKNLPQNSPGICSGKFPLDFCRGRFLTDSFGNPATHFLKKTSRRCVHSVAGSRLSHVGKFSSSVWRAHILGTSFSESYLKSFFGGDGFFCSKRADTRETLSMIKPAQKLEIDPFLQKISRKPPQLGGQKSKFSRGNFQWVPPPSSVWYVLTPPIPMSDWPFFFLCHRNLRWYLFTLVKAMPCTLLGGRTCWKNPLAKTPFRQARCKTPSGFSLIIVLIYFDFCVFLSAVAFWPPNALPGPYAWVLVSFLGVTLDSAKTPCQDATVFWFMTCSD